MTGVSFAERSYRQRAAQHVKITNQEPARRAISYHPREATRSNDVSSVDQAVEVAGGLLDRVPHLLVTVDFEGVRDQVQGMLVVLDFRIQPGQVEAIQNVVFVNLAEVFVAAG